MAAEMRLVQYLKEELKLASIFSRILSGEIPSQKILEDEHNFAFLDINPINPGHTLVIPKREVDEVFALDENEAASLMVFARKIGRSLKIVTACKRVGMMVAGFEVPHAHIHLVPLNSEGELSFSRAKPATQEELESMGDKIRAHVGVAH